MIIDISSIVLLTTLIISSIGLYKFNKIKEIWLTLYKKYKNIKFIINTLKGVNVDLSPNEPTVITSDRNMSLTYKFCGANEHKLYIPYDIDRVSKMTYLKAQLLLPNGHCVDITQQPGIPYMLCAADLGGISIVICNEDNGKSYIYYSTHIPGYADRLMDDYVESDETQQLATSAQQITPSIDVQ